MLHLLLIGVNRRTRNTYGLIKNGVGIGFHLADETTWLKEEENQNKQQLRKGLECFGISYHTSCVSWEVNCFCRC